MPKVTLAQHKFTWPDSVTAIARYTTPEECVAGTKRITKWLVDQSYRDIDIDTMPLAALERLPDTLQPVITFARECLRNFDPQTFPLADGWELLFKLSYQERQPDIRALLERRRLDGVALDDTIQRAAILDTVVGIYLSVYPHDLSLIDSLLEVRLSLPPIGIVNRDQFDFNTKQLIEARKRNDRTRMLRAAARIKQWNAKIPGEMRRRNEFRTWRKPIYQALNLLNEQEAFDSLKRGSAGFITLRTANWLEVNGGYLAGEPFPVGTQAEPLQTDFWWGPDDTATDAPPQTVPTVRPASGRVNLVVFLGHACMRRSKPTMLLPYWHIQRDCYRTYGAVQRIARQFPELDVTIVTQTYGYFPAHGPVAPREEAQYLFHWKQWSRLPGTLVVAETPFIRLAEPDRRRINEVLPQVTSYAFGERWEGVEHVFAGKGFLIDREGRILHAVPLAVPGINNLWSEQEFVDLLTAIFSGTTEPVAKSPETSPSPIPAAQEAQATTAASEKDSSAVLDRLSDERITQTLKLIPKIGLRFATDLEGLREIIGALLSPTIFKSDSKSLLPGETEPKSLQWLRAELDSAGLSRSQLRESFFAMSMAYELIELEKTKGIDVANETRTKDQTRLSVEELDRFRKRLADAEPVFEQIKKFMAKLER